MRAKALEIRDAGTFIAALAVDMNPSGLFTAAGAQRYLLRRCGYPCDGKPNVILTRLDGYGTATNDPYYWPASPRTMRIAHKWILEHWNELEDGSVVCVENILGERDEPKKSERDTVPI